jgi:hypothetical protein
MRDKPESRGQLSAKCATMRLTLVRVIVCLLNERQLLTLGLVQTALDRVRLFELLKCKDE